MLDLYNWYYKRLCIGKVTRCNEDEVRGRLLGIGQDASCPCGLPSTVMCIDD